MERDLLLDLDFDLLLDREMLHRLFGSNVWDNGVLFLSSNISKFISFKMEKLLSEFNFLAEFFG